MLNLIILPGHHDRASPAAVIAGDDAALLRASLKAASFDKVTPAVRALLRWVIANHHDDGTLSRCHHLLTACGRAPRSEAISSRDGQSSITSRKDCMPASIVRNVLTHKPYEPTEIALATTGQNVLQFPAMGQDINENDFAKAVVERVKAARQRKGWSQTEMAAILEIKQGTYHKYECRTVMPAYLLTKFCFHVGATPNDIYYGNLAAAVARRAKVTLARGKMVRRRLP